MTDNASNTDNEQQVGEPGATEAAQVLHGDRARAEQHEQPAGDETVTLTGDTIIAKHPAAPGEQ